MSGNLPMRRRAGNAKVKYSATYLTGAERSAKKTFYYGVGLHRSLGFAIERRT